MKNKLSIGFIGAGGIARSHVLAINALTYYYNDPPDFDLVSVSSASENSRKSFSEKYGFRKSMTPDEFFSDNEIDTVYILGPNSVHYDHFQRALMMPSVKRIYIEKPLCSNASEEKKMAELTASRPDVRIQTGFQYLFMTPIREALILWNSGIFGEPLHFDLKYYHGDYLQKSYRDKRTNRLTPAPDGGAMADLGSHAISLALAFLGNELEIKGALKGGSFPDVDPYSDLFSLVTIQDRRTGASGTISASRIASGTGDMLSTEIFCKNGSLRFSSHEPDSFEYYLEKTSAWMRVNTGSSYRNITSFPSGHVPAGWLRSMIHAHYVFLSGKSGDDFIPDLRHGLEVQRIIRQFSEMIK